MEKIVYLYLPLCAFIALNIYGIKALDNRDKRLNSSYSKVLKILHFISMGVCLITLGIFTRFQIDLNGIWTTRVVIVFAILTGISIRFLTNKTALNPIEKKYFNAFSNLPIAIGVILLVFPYAIMFIISASISLAYPVEKIYYEDKSIRVQHAFSDIFEPSSSIYIVQKKEFIKKMFLTAYIEDLE